MEVYAGEPGTVERISTVRIPFITFLSILQERLLTSFVFLHSLTQATDTSNIRAVFATVKETILQSAVKDRNIL